jgi:hypothetical protein
LKGQFVGPRRALFQRLLPQLNHPSEDMCESGPQSHERTCAEDGCGVGHDLKNAPGIAGEEQSQGALSIQFYGATASLRSRDSQME